MKKRICQINNLRIYQIQDYNYRFMVITPDNRHLEEFRYLRDAKLFCEQTKDFIVKK